MLKYSYDIAKKAAGFPQQAFLSFVMAMFMLLSLGGAHKAHAVGPEAGEIIRNIASVTYLNGATLVQETVMSNEVEVSINAVPSLTLSAPVSLVGGPGQVASFTYQLVNTGNTTLNVVPDLGAFTGDFSVGLPVLGIDADADGVISPSEALVAGSSLPMAIGEVINLTVFGTVSELALLNEQAMATLTVTEPTIGAPLTTTATIIVDSVNLETVKTVSAASAFTGDQLIYTLKMRTTTSVDLTRRREYEGAPLLLDGVQMDVVLVRDPLPVGVLFDEFITSADFTPAFHIRGDDAYSFTQNRPADISDVDEVVWLLSTDFAAGSQREVSFSALVDDVPAATTLTNVAFVVSVLPSGTVVPFPSSPAMTIVDVAADPGTSEVIYFPDSSFNGDVPFVGFDDAVFIEVRSASCNATGAVDIIPLLLETQPSGDRETVMATETGPNTSIFRVGPIDVSNTGFVTSEDGTISADADDNLVTVPQCDLDISASVPVETVGSVFISLTNEPVEGATVNLLDENGIILETVVTDADGRFALSLPVLGGYRVEVTGLDGFTSPSVITDFSGFGRDIDPSGSFSGNFMASEVGGRVDFDIPVDPITEGALAVNKTGNKTTARPGETITYAVEVRNNSAFTLEPTRIRDMLPRGFEFVEGSANIDGTPIAVPTLGAGATIFELGALAPNEVITLAYTVRVTHQAGIGRRTNLATAEGNLGNAGTVVFSNTAQHSVEIRRDGSVFSSDGVVLGKVFLDCNEDGVQNDGERGIPGVQLHTQEGVYVVTDGKGRFSLPRLRAQTHVIDLYEATLPDGAYVANSRVLDAGNGGSRFVPLRSGEIRSEDFAVRGCSAAVKADVAARITKFAEGQNETDAENLNSLQFEEADSEALNEIYEKSARTAIFGSLTPSKGPDTRETVRLINNQPVFEQSFEVVEAASTPEYVPDFEYVDLPAPGSGLALHEPEAIDRAAAISHEAVVFAQPEVVFTKPLSTSRLITDKITGQAVLPLLNQPDAIPHTALSTTGDCIIAYDGIGEGFGPDIQCAGGQFQQEAELISASADKRPVGLVEASAVLRGHRVQDVLYKDENGKSYTSKEIRERSSEVVLKNIETTRDLEAEIKKYSDDLAFIDLSNGDVLSRDVISIRVKGPAKGKLVLTLNGTPVDAARIGQTVTQKAGADAKAIQALEYVAVKLEAGKNTLSLTQTDPFGNERGREDITVRVPGKAARLAIVAPQTAKADPLATFPVILRVVDDAGLPVASPIEVTLSASEGLWDVEDLRDTEPGVQAYVDNGEAVFDFKPSAIVGTHTIMVKSQFGMVETEIQFSPDLDIPPVFVGFIEGAFKFGDRDTQIEGLLSTENLNVFEETEEGVNGEVYLKGKIKGDALLTLRYDSDKDTEARLFRDIEPDRFYPVYGDTSEKGFDARSRGKLFVKVEKGQSYILYGDVRYTPEHQAFQLGSFQRSLEGARAHFEKGRVSVNFYAAETNATQQVVEIPALGVSGPYALDFDNVVENSEVVEIITRDRDQPSVIISAERLVRFNDYTLDYFARSLIFTNPVSSVDADLNPVSIRVTFEQEDETGEDYLVYGGEVLVKITDRLTAGYRELRSDAPAGPDRRTVRAGFVEKHFENEGILQLEVAQTEYDAEITNTGVGATPSVEEITAEAVRLSYVKNGEKLSVSARASYADEGFNAPGASVQAGNIEARAEATYRATDDTKIRGEALYSEDTVQDETLYGIVVTAEKQVTQTLSVRAGARYSEIDREAEEALLEDTGDTLLSLLVGASWAPEFLKGANLDVELEQSLSQNDAFRAAVSADYNITSKMRAYLVSEWSSSEAGQFSILENNRQNTTIRGGVEYKYNENITAFSEYRANRGLFDAGLANGLAASYDISESLRLRGRFEHVEPLTEVFQGNTAASVGATWEPAGNKTIISGDIEYSIAANDQESWFVTNTVGHKVGDTTFLARNRFALSEQAEGDRIRDRARIGAAYRPESNEAVNALAWYEYGLEDDIDTVEERHLWSVGAEFKPAAKTRIRPRIAGQKYSLETATFDEENTIHLAQIGADQDITDRINLGANIAALSDGDFDNVTYGVGVEANVVVMDNVLVGLGYNHTDLETEALEDLYDVGAYVRVRVKFDEDTWNIFD